MVNFSKLAARAKKAVDAAGGPDAVKDKAAGLKEVAAGKGSLSDKAKRAAEVVREKEPAGGEPAVARPQPDPAPDAPEAGQAERRARRERRREDRPGKRA